MNTPAHLLFGAAVFAQPARRGTLAAALAGGLAPDLSLYVLVGWHLGVIGTDPQVVFGELYYSVPWQSVFAVDNSIFVWAAVLGMGLWRRVPWLVSFAGAALLHIGFDLPFHAGDGRPHFWPLSDWVFHSPLSYWDARAGGRWVGVAEVVLAVVASLVLWRRFPDWRLRAGFVLLLLATLGSSGVWRYVF